MGICLTEDVSCEHPTQAQCSNALTPRVGFFLFGFDVDISLPLHPRQQIARGLAKEYMRHGFQGVDVVR